MCWSVFAHRDGCASIAWLNVKFRKTHGKRPAQQLALCRPGPRLKVNLSMLKRLRRSAAALVAAVCMVSVAACGGGAGGATTATKDGNAPKAVIRTAALAITEGSQTGVQVQVGTALNLDGSASVAKSVSRYTWSVSVRPPGSAATIQYSGSAVASFVPDLAGSYELALTLDADGTTVSTRLPVTVVSTAAVRVDASINLSAPVAVMPTQNLAVGALVALDASRSTSDDGQVAVSFAVLSAPAQSKAALTVSNAQARFTPDLPGAYQLVVRATAQNGLWAESVYPLTVYAAAPTAVVAASVSVAPGSTQLTAGLGNLVSIDGRAAVADASLVDTRWTLLAKPASSQVSALNKVSAATMSFVPDVAGTYQVEFQVTEKATGLATQHIVSVQAVPGPQVVVSAASTPVVQAAGPTYVADVGSAVTLRGSGSYDPSGETLRYQWTLSSVPTNSQANLVNPTTATPTLTPDVPGLYSVMLEVINTSGLRAAQTLNLRVGRSQPVVVLDRTQLTLAQGNTAMATAASSYSPDGNSLTYQWSLDTRPAGSSASLASPNQAVLRFVPDVAGTYYATVTVSDGPVSAVAGVSISVINISSGTVPLDYQPLISRFSKSLHKAVIVTTTPHALHLVDPTTGRDVAVALPAAVKAMSLSADGRLAGVLHEANVSLVDLDSATLIRTMPTGGSHTEVLTSNAGMLFVTGQTGGQWVSPAMTSLDGRTGAQVATGGGYSSIYGTTRAVLAESMGRIYTLSEGLSPAQMYWHNVTPATGAFASGGGQSPYWGDYTVSTPMWLAADESLIFTSSGTYFRTADLVYAGNLGTRLHAISHSLSAAEALVVPAEPYSFDYGYQAKYPKVVQRYTGSLLFPAGSVSVPLVGGQEAYALSVFHAADDRRVYLVQTGSAVIAPSGQQYFLLLR